MCVKVYMCAQGLSFAVCVCVVYTCTHGLSQALHVCEGVLTVTVCAHAQECLLLESAAPICRCWRSPVAPLPRVHPLGRQDGPCLSINRPCKHSVLCHAPFGPGSDNVIMSDHI